MSHSQASQACFCGRCSHIPLPPLYQLLAAAIEAESLLQTRLGKAKAVAFQGYQRTFACAEMEPLQGIQTSNGLKVIDGNCSASWSMSPPGWLKHTCAFAFLLGMVRTRVASAASSVKYIAVLLPDCTVHCRPCRQEACRTALKAACAPPAIHKTAGGKPRAPLRCR